MRAYPDFSKVTFDTSPFIYLIEQNEKYLECVLHFFEKLDMNIISGYTSTVTLLEALVIPMRNDDHDILKKYKDIIVKSKNMHVISLSPDISEIAASLRAKYYLRTPDCIQLATGIFTGSDILLTNDKRLKKVNEIKVVLLDDLILS